MRLISHEAATGDYNDPADQCQFFDDIFSFLFFFGGLDSGWGDSVTGF